MSLCQALYKVKSYFWVVIGFELMFVSYTQDKIQAIRAINLVHIKVAIKNERNHEDKIFATFYFYPSVQVYCFSTPTQALKYIADIVRLRLVLQKKNKYLGSDTCKN